MAERAGWKTEELAEALFRRYHAVWRRMAAAGQCDEWGGAECRRVWWVMMSRTDSELTELIHIAANTPEERKEGG